MVGMVGHHSAVDGADTFLPAVRSSRKEHVSNEGTKIAQCRIGFCGRSLCGEPCYCSQFLVIRAPSNRALSRRVSAADNPGCRDADACAPESPRGQASQNQYSATEVLRYECDVFMRVTMN